MSDGRADWVGPGPLRIPKRISTAAALAAAVLLLLSWSTAAAHEGAPRLILEPNEVSPGGVVLIRGEDLGLDEDMRVSLVGDAGQVDLAAITTDGQGHFTIAVEIPADVPVGPYAIEAVSAFGGKVTSIVRLAGSPILPGDGALPGQDEGFPAQPLASQPPAAAPVAEPAASAGAGLRPLSDPTGSAAGIDLVPFVALAGAIGALGVLVWRTRRPPAAAA